MRLVLWDIDGTLVESGGAGAHAFADAFAAVVGRPSDGLALMAGRTDHDIAIETLEQNGVEDGEALWPAFAEALATALSAREDQMAADGHALPGGREAIAALEATGDAVQTLLTGNVRPNAATKLRAFGLEGLLDLEIGAYGSDARERNALVAIARERAEAREGIEIASEDVVLIGDTPRDVEAGRANGARVVAVATGRFTVEELEEAGADVALPGLVDTETLVAAVLAPTEVGT